MHLTKETTGINLENYDVVAVWRERRGDVQGLVLLTGQDTNGSDHTSSGVIRRRLQVYVRGM